MQRRDQEIRTEGTVIRWARFYDILLKLGTLGREAHFRNRILEVADLRPGQRVLDVGCGTGTLAIAAARMVGDDGRVVGIDPAIEMIDRARAKATGVGATVDFQVAVIEDLPFETSSLDAVMSSLVFHHLTASLKKTGLAEIERVLEPGGRLFVADFGTDASMERLVAETREAGFGAIETGYLGPRVLRYLKAEALP